MQGNYRAESMDLLILVVVPFMLGWVVGYMHSQGSKHNELDKAYHAGQRSMQPSGFEDG